MHVRLSRTRSFKPRVETAESRVVPSALAPVGELHRGGLTVDASVSGAVPERLELRHQRFDLREGRHHRPAFEFRVGGPIAALAAHPVGNALVLTGASPTASAAAAPATGTTPAHLASSAPQVDPPKLPVQGTPPPPAVAPPTFDSPPFPWPPKYPYLGYDGPGGLIVR